ncbi:unnamed protein product [Parnassius apollo]|uniref:(apollo) hypothetical protein n=1 Tax=Parnassius apollo TaxID=110799 RepID=A0A8S3VYR6_PARAO|nr:unnamed protein product [Parnassius apollo]
METKCSGCNELIFDILCIECSQKTCRKVYHYMCVSITAEQYQNFTEEEKGKWVRPECRCNIPKVDNTNTPVRGVCVMDKSFSPSFYMNKERRDRHNYREVCNDSRIIEEIREFRMEMISRLDDQMKKCKRLEKRFIKTETELRELKNIMNVVQQKANKVDELEERIKVLTEINERLETTLTVKNTAKEILQTNVEQLVSFANITKQNKNTVVKNNGPNKEGG